MSAHTLSTTAFRTYWLGRYIERAGSTARLVMVNTNLLIDLPVRLPLGWQPLVEILAQKEGFAELYQGTGTKRSPEASERSIVRFLLSDPRNPATLISALNYARENARVLRGKLPRAAFEYINEAHMDAKEMLAEPLSRTRRNAGLQQVIERLDQINGFLSSAMLHNASWQFYRLGNFIERADMTTRIIDLGTADLVGSGSDLAPFSDIQWRSVLNSLDAMQGYTATVQKPVNQADVLQFLLQNSELPRSLQRSFNTIRNCLRALPDNGDLLDQINRMRRQLQRAQVGNLVGQRLQKYLDARQKQLLSLHQRINNQYFAKQ